MKKTILFFMLIASPLQVFSEDIELYLLDASLAEQTKPQVLLIVDTSGSMTSNETIKTPFDSSQQYQIKPGSFSDSASEYLYYVVGSPDVLPSGDSPTEHRRFKAVLNNCSTAVSRLNSAGFYTGRIKQYEFEGNTGSWEDLNAIDGQAITIVDCEDDINLDLANASATPVVAAEHNSNTVTVTTGTTTTGTSTQGYPIDGLGTPVTPIYYHTDISQVDANWSGDIVTLYTDKYLRWEQGTKLRNGTTDIGTTNESRLSIAKRTLSNLVDSIPSVKFGLEVFNFDNGSDTDQTKPHGGRIAFGIQEMTATAKSELLTIINGDPAAAVDNSIHGSGWTPLCESYYEAYRYFAGLSVMYGDQDVDGMNGTKPHSKDKPGRDTSSATEISNGIYKTPYGGCSDKVFVILITDGEPTRDSSTDTFVAALKAGADPALGADAVAVGGNSLPILAAYMNTNDINSSLSGTQTAHLYTVGFSGGAAGAANLLEKAAENGGGQYYDATDPTKLGSKLQEALTSILSVNTSFVSPTVVANGADRTETLDSVYYAMFKAKAGARWNGNLKKLKVKNDVQVDRDDNVAIAADGGIDPNARTFWDNSTSADGNDVDQGGVVGMFNNKTDARTLYTDTLASNSLSLLTYNNLPAVFGNAAAGKAALGVSNAADAQDYLKWAFGIETVTGAAYTYRSDIFGDPLHSKPVAINYGGTGTSPDVRILVGTNAGVLHMFKDQNDVVEETWGFMPKEFISNIKVLKDNLPTSSKIYGVDGRITTHIIDKNGDGIINKDDDTVWAFFGLRRGGTSYYGLNITDPDDPKLLWKINANDPGYEELGQTWSQPQIGYSKLNIPTNGIPKPVLVFGAGYSISKDLSGPGVADTVGRGIYMVDAFSGELKWSVTPAAATITNTQFAGFTDSIPSKISILDSDGDGLMDRLYTGDTGGNVFRIDMPGADPKSTTSPWTVFKFAELGAFSESPKTNLNDRRFFDSPSIVRTFFTDTIETTINSVTTVIKQETPYDAILIGSGDRSTPTATDTNDEFFMIQDMNVITQSFVAGATAPAKSIPTTITYDDLYDFTGNPYGSTPKPTDAALRTLDLAVSAKSGWRHDYVLAGEKSTAKAIAVEGIAYFTSFTPGGSDADADANVCDLATGQGRLYAVDLYKGRSSYIGRENLTVVGMPDSPVLATAPLTPVDPLLPVDPNAPPGKLRPSLVLLPGGKAFPLDTRLKTSRSYQYVTEQN